VELSRTLGLAAGICGLLVAVSRMPAIAAGNGPLGTPLSSFTDGTIPRHVYTVPGVLKKNGFVTEFLCTNLSPVGAPANIGVEVFDNTGTQLNSVSATPAPGSTPVPRTCDDSGNGAVLNVMPGSTVTIATGGTAQMHEDCKMTMASFDNGSARIVSTASRVACSAFVIDSKNVIVDSTGMVTGRSPSAVSLKVIKKNKQLGD